MIRPSVTSPGFPHPVRLTFGNPNPPTWLDTQIKLVVGVYLYIYKFIHKSIIIIFFINWSPHIFTASRFISRDSSAISSLINTTFITTTYKYHIYNHYLLQQRPSPSFLLTRCGQFSALLNQSWPFSLSPADGCRLSPTITQVKWLP